MWLDLEESRGQRAGSIGRSRRVKGLKCQAQQVRSDPLGGATGDFSAVTCYGTSDVCWKTSRLLRAEWVEGLEPVLQGYEGLC